MSAYQPRKSFWDWYKNGRQPKPKKKTGRKPSLTEDGQFKCSNPNCDQPRHSVTQRYCRDCAKARRGKRTVKLSNAKREKNAPPVPTIVNNYIQDVLRMNQYESEIVMKAGGTVLVWNTRRFEKFHMDEAVEYYKR